MLQAMAAFDSTRYLKLLRAGVILLVGGTVALIGVIMIFTPGPASLVIPAGIAILATEFAWARRLLDRAKAEVAKRMGRKDAAPPPEPS